MLKKISKIHNYSNKSVKYIIFYNVFWFFLTAVIIFIDQLTKTIVVDNMELGENVPVVDNFFQLHYVLNPGAGLGMLSDARWVFMLFTSLVIIFSVFLLSVHYFNSVVANISLIFILSGGIGNMIDRIFKGVVVDFLQFEIRFFDFIFNVADVFITFGTIIFIFYYMFLNDKEVKDHTKDE